LPVLEFWPQVIEAPKARILSGILGGSSARGNEREREVFEDAATERRRHKNTRWI
jgi:hypothetical protein